MDKVNIEIATADVERWLNHKKISDKKRASYKANIESLVDAVVAGQMTINEECVITHNLSFEFGEETKIKSLNYKPRVSIGQVQQYLKDVKSDDADGRIVGYISALTGQPREIVKKLDTEDYSVAQSIAIFFL